jgi:hypothetical protein
LAGSRFRRHPFWLIGRLARGLAILALISLPLLTPLIHDWRVRLLFVTGELLIFMLWGLFPILAWQRFRLWVEHDCIIVEEFVLFWTVRRELPRASTQLQLSPTLWPLPWLTMTIQQDRTTYSYALLTRADGG